MNRRVAETREIVQTRYGLALGGQDTAGGDDGFLEEDQGDELLQRITHDSCEENYNSGKCLQLQ